MFDPDRDLRLASFNGIPFWVLNAKIEAGHRVATTHIPGARHVNEAFGPSARKFEVEAYVTGDQIPAADALLLAAEAAHLGALTLPDQLSVVVRLTKARRAFERDKLGYIVIDIEAVAEPITLGGLGGFALDQRLFALAGLAIDLFRLLAGPLGTSEPAAIMIAQEAAQAPLADLAALATLARLAPADAATVTAAIDAAAALPAGPIDPVAYGAALAGAAVALGDVAGADTLAEAMRLLGPPAAPMLAAGTTVATSAGNAALLAGQALTGAARALALGEAHARAEWADRPAALAARALAEAVFSDALGHIGRDALELRRLLAQIGTTVSERCTQRAASLAPLVTVAAGRSMPSLAWAWSLYADPARADQLVSRSRAPHPGFLPERFEALAE